MNFESINTIPQNVSNFKANDNKKNPSHIKRNKLPDTAYARDVFVSETKKNGLFERLYNKIKNMTKMGVGSDKVESEITKAEKGEVTQEEALDTIDKYRKSQENAEQVIGDVASMSTSAALFFKLRPYFKTMNAAAKIDSGLMDRKYGKETNFVTKLIKKTLSSKTRSMLLILGLAGLVGGLSKDIALKINRIGSKKYSTDKAEFNNLQTIEDELDYKEERSEKGSMKFRDNLRHFASGTINGLLLPITVLGGGFVGVPLYLIANTMNRYFVGNSTDGKESDKSFNNYVESLKNDGLLHASLALGMAVPLVKKGNWASILDKNLSEISRNLMGKTLKDAEYGGETMYAKLEGFITGDASIEKILDKHNPELYEGNTFFEEFVKDEMSKYSYLSEQDAKRKVAFDFENKLKEKLVSSIGEEDAKKQVKREMKSIYGKQVEKLSDENLFAVKMLQISNEREISKILQENCPPTRTLEEATTEIQRVFGDKYEVRKCLGVGTIAETYLVKAKDGKEYCIKMLKAGINEAKIDADKQKCIDIIKDLKKSKDEEELLIRNIEDLAKKLKEEVDFTKEMDNATKLSKHTKTANVVKGVEVKDNLYVMEKANGISLKSLTELNTLVSEEKYVQKKVENLRAGKLSDWEEKHFETMSDKMTRDEFIQKQTNYWESRANDIKSDIEELKSHMPDFDDITNLTDKESMKILEEYDKLLIEQYQKLNAEGKTIHGDIHPGNIFIDLKALRSGKGKIFTLIDTGNTIDLTKEQTKKSLQLTSFTKRADIPDIVEYVLDGAVYSDGMTKEQASKLISEDLKKLFFDYETKLEPINNDSILTITSNIMSNYGILPGDTALALSKAKTSANGSYRDLCDVLFSKKGDKHDFDSTSGKVKGMGDIIATVLKLRYKHDQRVKMQERWNLRQMSVSEKRAYRNNPNLLKENSKEYLTYNLKQILYQDSKYAESAL